jgi:hypothetical protein
MRSYVLLRALLQMPKFNLDSIMVYATTERKRMEERRVGEVIKFFGKII